MLLSMGTLKDQPVRNSYYVTRQSVEQLIDEVLDISNNTGHPFESVLRVYELLETRRRNDLLKDNGDIHDEQMAGIGDELTKLSEAIKDRRGSGENL